MDHLKRHIKRSGPTCRWRACRARLTDDPGLVKHLKRDHGVNLRKTAFPGTHCNLCHTWFDCEFSWDEHCDQHIRDLEDFGCAPTEDHPGRCVFCLGDAVITPSKRFRQFNTLFALHQHIQTHFTSPKSAAGRIADQQIRCPHPLCQHQNALGYEGTKEGLKDHIEQVHEILKSAKRKRSQDDAEGDPGEIRGDKRAH